MVWTYPSEKYESQLGWWHSQYDGKNIFFQTTNHFLIRCSMDFTFYHGWYMAEYADIMDFQRIWMILNGCNEGCNEGCNKWCNEWWGDHKQMYEEQKREDQPQSKEIEPLFDVRKFRATNLLSGSSLRRSHLSNLLNGKQVLTAILSKQENVICPSALHLSASKPNIQRILCWTNVHQKKGVRRPVVSHALCH